MAKRKKILWIGDDIRMNSGCSTMGREMVLNTVHKYDYAIIAGAITHPDKGKVFDLSQETNKLKGMTDSYVKLYPVEGYGTEQILFQIMSIEKPDALCMITDPRYFTWLFSLEHQIRASGVPIVYWNIWDSVPLPQWNKSYYESCDALFSISKQTYNINKWVVGPSQCGTITGTFDESGNSIPFNTLTERK